jgi:hypothetical protein
MVPETSLLSGLPRSLRVKHVEEERIGKFSADLFLSCLDFACVVHTSAGDYCSLNFLNDP